MEIPVILAVDDYDDLQAPCKARVGARYAGAEYQDLPMSLADASLVRLAELQPGASVVTLDAHFRIYRKNGRQQIPVIIP